MPSSSHPLRIAVDTGGTFTDCVWIERGRLRILKLFSTPDDPSRAIAEAIAKIVVISPANAAAFILLHGTTVGTNTLLQRKGARVAFVTTTGFEDTIEIGRQARPKLYDFFFDRIEPLVPPELRFGVATRIGPQGELIREAHREELEHLADEIQSKQPNAIAISLLFSFASPASEQKVAEALRRLKLPLSISSEILPEFREYERASTVVLNAYLQPVMERYLNNLARSTAISGRDPAPDSAFNEASDPRIFVMQSSGGIASLSTAAREPVRTVLSGPAGGVVGAAAMARHSGFDRIVSFDMGGTSTDVALVDREAKATNEAEVAGLPVRVPMLDIHTVGAGGGSLARFDAAGALRVGPESAGADPGPICYGRGEQPTVTDANLLLGRLRPDRFLGGTFSLDVQRTRTIVRDWLRRQRSTMSVEQFAAGVIRVVNSTMEKAIRVVSIERGYDTREFALVAFGGAGALHACELAAGLGIPTVIVPAMPGALSAYGILVSDIVKDYSRTVLLHTREKLPTARLQSEYQKLVNAAEKSFRAEHWAGKIQLSRSADLRYRGQGFELNVPFGPKMLEAFHVEHQRRYGYCKREREVEIVTLRLRARIPGPKLPPQPAVEAQRASAEHAPVWFDGKPIRTAIIARETLRPRRRRPGPAIITEYSATTVVPPRTSYELDSAGNLILRLSPATGSKNKKGAPSGASNAVKRQR